MLFNQQDSPKSAPSRRASALHLIHGFLVSPDSASQSASRSVQSFCTVHDRQSLYFTMDCSLKIAFRWNLSNTWFLGPTQVHIPNGIAIGLATSAGHTVVTDKQTDRPRYSVCSNSLHLASAAMRP